MFKEGGRGKRTSGGIKRGKPQDTVRNANDGAVFNEVVRILGGATREVPRSCRTNDKIVCATEGA